MAPAQIWTDQAVLRWYTAASRGDDAFGDRQMSKTTTRLPVAGILLLTLTAGVHAQQQRHATEAPADAQPSVEEAPTEPTAVVAAEDIGSIGFFRRLSLGLQLILTPTALANNVAPLNAYDKKTICGDSFRHAALESVSLLGPSAIVRKDRGDWQAAYYTSIEDAYDAVDQEGICDDNPNSNDDNPNSNDEPYVATTFPVRNWQPDLELLMMDAARSLPGWSKPAPTDLKPAPALPEDR